MTELTERQHLLLDIFNYELQIDKMINIVKKSYEKTIEEINNNPREIEYDTYIMFLLYNIKLYESLKAKDINKALRLFDLIKATRTKIFEIGEELDLNSNEYLKASKILKNDYETDEKLKNIILNIKFCESF